MMMKSYENIAEERVIISKRELHIQQILGCKCIIKEDDSED